MTVAPQFIVIGAGGIGGVTGAHLARAGYEVLLVDRVRDHVRAIAVGGLAVEGAASFHVRVPATTPDALASVLAGRAPRTVLLAVNAQDTAAALGPVVPLLDAHSVVVSMQNGLNERLIAERIGAHRTIGAFVNFGADYLAPGRVLMSSRAELYLGELDGRITDRLEQLGAIFRTAVLEHTQLTGNIWGHLWGKLGYVSMLFANATTDETMGDAFADLDNRALFANLAGEVVRVADAEGVRCEGFAGYDPDAMRFVVPREWAAIHRSLDRRVVVNRASINARCGMWRDMAMKHRRTEVDAHLGLLAEIAAAHGLAVPLNARLIEVIHDLEEGRRVRQPANLEELRVLNDRCYPSDDRAASRRGHPGTA